MNFNSPALASAAAPTSRSAMCFIIFLPVVDDDVGKNIQKV